MTRNLTEKEVEEFRRLRKQLRQDRKIGKFTDNLPDRELDMLNKVHDFGTDTLLSSVGEETYASLLRKMRKVDSEPQ